MHSEPAALAGWSTWDHRGTNSMPCDDAERDARAKLREVPALPLRTCECTRHLAPKVLPRCRRKRSVGDHGGVLGACSFISALVHSGVVVVSL